MKRDNVKRLCALAVLAAAAAFGYGLSGTFSCPEAGSYQCHGCPFLATHPGWRADMKAAHAQPDGI
ncbi:MAG: hypothetical protein KGL53_15455 [Elusimicrobia bacterium]|nr:hypothetical protein [Elusimicrobiota bacterium]